MEESAKEMSRPIKLLMFDRDRIKKYSTINNKRALLDIFARLSFHLLCIVFGYLELVHGNYWVATVILIPHFIAYSFLGWAGIGHELFHNTVFSSKSVNVFLFKLFSILTWNNYKYFEVTHWKHHKDTLLPDDPEGNPEMGLKGSGFVWYVLIDLPAFIRRIKVLVMNSFNHVPNGPSNFLFSKGTKAKSELCSAARTVLLFHALMILIFVYLQWYWCILIVNFAPFTLTIFNRILAVSQHYGTEHMNSNSNYFLNTRTVVLDRIFSFLYANMNYHVEHHFFPFIPYYNLPSVHNEIVQTNQYQHYSAGFLSLVRDLNKLGCFKN